jgi:hypothetical protein
MLYAQQKELMRPQGKTVPVWLCKRHGHEKPVAGKWVKIIRKKRPACGAWLRVNVKANIGH